jgi:hypothetical protein
LQAAQRIEIDNIQNQVDRAIALAHRISTDISSFYCRALNEDDPLKRFLFLFLTIERQTHAAFNAADHGAYINEIARSPDRVRKYGDQFLLSQHERWKNLSDRFHWCAMTVWPHLTDNDVRDFLEIKKIRDRLTHGVIAEPPSSAVVAVERISAKLQLAPPQDRKIDRLESEQ